MVGALFPSYTLHMVRNAAMRVILTCFGLEGFSQELREINGKKLPSSGRERFQVLFERVCSLCQSKRGEICTAIALIGTFRKTTANMSSDMKERSCGWKNEDWDRLECC